MSEYKPGAFALVQKNGGEWHRAMFAEDGEWICRHGINCRPDDVRPLVVLDLEDREQTARLADLFCEARWCHTKSGDSDECDPLTRSAMREALAAFVKPPKPAEPTGLGAVVEDENGDKWVRWCQQHRSGRVWKHSFATGEYHSYADIAAVRVLSEGVTDVRAD